MEWDSKQYLLFERERTRPCLDLVHRLDLSSPGRIVDLGCGTGTSTAALRQRWPDAAITGVDRSASMLRVARRSDRSVEWTRADIARWEPREPFDLVFSNAALQWLPDHPKLLPRLWRAVGPSGALAFQVPAPGPARERWHRAVEEVRRGERGDRPVRAEEISENVLSSAEYYRLLGPRARAVDLWDTEYHHVLPNAQAVVEWTRATGLRPVLAALRTAKERERFLAAYSARVSRAYRPQPDGRVLFPFRRRFVIAYRE